VDEKSYARLIRNYISFLEELFREEFGTSSWFTKEGYVIRFKSGGGITTRFSFKRGKYLIGVPETDVRPFEEFPIIYFLYEWPHELIHVYAGISHEKDRYYDEGLATVCAWKILLKIYNSEPHLRKLSLILGVSPEKIRDEIRDGCVAHHINMLSRLKFAGLISGVNLNEIPFPLPHEIRKEMENSLKLKRKWHEEKEKLSAYEIGTLYVWRCIQEGKSLDQLISSYVTDYEVAKFLSIRRVEK
jgi:hypothetical protein